MKIRIAHIITALEADGAEMMLYKLLGRMDRLRFEPIVLTLRSDGPLRPRIEELGIPVLSARSFPALLRSKPHLLQGWMYHGNLAAQAFGELRRAGALAGETACPTISQCVSDATRWGRWGRRFRLPFRPNEAESPDRLRTPVIWNVRGSHHVLRDEKPGTAAAIWMGARLSGRPSRIVNNSVTSARLHEQYLGYASDRWEIIPNGFEPDQFAPSPSARCEARAELAIPDNAILIGLAGRYHPMKDHANFVHAAARLSLRVPQAHFLFAGAGADTNNTALCGLLREAGITGRTRLLGARTDMPRVMAALDIATSSSCSEGFPNVIGEAMSCGAPCVVTDVGDSAWLVGPAGLVVPPRDAPALARAWEDLIVRGEERRRELGQRGRERIVSHFSMAAVTGRYETLFQRVLDSQRGRGYQPCAA